MENNTQAPLVYGDLSGGHPEPPYSAPDYTAGPLTAFRRFFARGLRFKGRASRREYWWVQLIVFLVSFVLAMVATAAGDGSGVTTSANVISWVFALAVLVPSISLSWRRLHDAGYAGPWWFLSFIPLIGSIVLIVLTVQPSRPAKRKREWEDREVLTLA
jgi:uncharacterized membrane protein YhaH (DUF805 family)